MEENAVCPRCGIEREPKHKFCPECGFSYEGTPEVAVPPGVNPPYQPPFQYAYPPMLVVPARSKDGSCVASLVLGILAWLLPLAGLLLSVLAIFFAVTGIRKVDRNPNTLTGKGMGVAGLVLGISGLVVAIVVAIFVLPGLFSVKDMAWERTCQSQMRDFLLACEIYAEDKGGYPASMSQLAPDYLDEELRCPKDNSRYTIRWKGYYSCPEISCPNHGSP